MVKKKVVEAQPIDQEAEDKALRAAKNRDLNVALAAVPAPKD